MNSLVRFISLIMLWLCLCLGSFCWARPQSTESYIDARPRNCVELQNRYQLGGYSALPCQFDFSKFRPIDPKLTDLDKNGLKSIRYSGTEFLVHNVEEIDKIKSKLRPGDQLVLDNGQWKDQEISLSGLQGTEEHPILIRPRTRGGVVFSGKSSISVYGRHVVIWDLSFRQGWPTKESAAVIQLGNSKNPCQGCVLSHITIDGVNNPNSSQWSMVKSFYVIASGQDISIAHSVFRDKKHIGPMILAAGTDLASDQPQGLHIVDNIFSGRPKIDNNNGYEVIQLGWSGNCTHHAYSIIENNRFEQANGENEIITVKMSDVWVRRNYFQNSLGNLSLRAANRVLVEGNTFDGKGQNGAGGIRVMGALHWIIENHFNGLKNPANYTYWPISLAYAGDEELIDNIKGYARAKNVVIAKNLFTNNDQGIAVGINKRPEYPLPPNNISILANSYISKSLISADRDNNKFPIVYPDLGATDIKAKNNSVTSHETH